MESLRPKLTDTVDELNNILTNGKFDTRYALVGFGGAGIFERAHTHTLRMGKKLFGSILELKRELKSLKFDGDDSTTNDGYHAILTASKMQFRPAAQKIFIMLNSEPQTSHNTGPSLDE